MVAGGRPRKPGERYPSGKLRPAPKPTFEPISGAEWQRIRTAGKKLGADPRLSSELSRLNLFGELTIVQTTAGHRVGEIYGRFERAHGRRRSVRSPSYERAFGADSSADDDREEAARAAFLALQETLARLTFVPPAPAGKCPSLSPRTLPRHSLIDALEQLCVEDRPVRPDVLPLVRSLLDHLAVAWGLTTVKKPHAGSARKPEKTRAPPPRVAKTNPINADKTAWLRTMRLMRPDLSEAQLERAYDLAQAIKDREIFERSKRKPARAEPDVAVSIDRPKLTLKEKSDA